MSRATTAQVDGARLQVITRAWQTARTRWPGLGIGVEQAAAHVQLLHPDLSAPELDALFLDEVVLAAALIAADAAAMAAFESDYVEAVAPKLRRFAGLNLEDSTQELRIRMLVAPSDQRPRIAKYTGKGPLLAWVRTAAIRVGINLSTSSRRAAKREQLAWAEALASTDVPEPELAELRSRFVTVLADAYRAAAADLSQAQRALLYLSLGQGVGIDRLATIYDIHRSTVARRIASAKVALKDRARALAMEQIQAGDATMNSIERLVHSQLEFSVQALAQ